MKSHTNPNFGLESKVFILHLIRYFENYQLTPICIKKLYRFVIDLQSKILQDLIRYEFIGIGTTSNRSSAKFDRNLDLSNAKPEDYLFITHDEGKVLEIKQFFNQSIQVL